MDNCGNPRANTCLNAPGNRTREQTFLRQKLVPVFPQRFTGQSNGDESVELKSIANSCLQEGDNSFKCLIYQLSMVGYTPTMVITGDGESGFDSGEGA